MIFRFFLSYSILALLKALNKALASYFAYNAKITSSGLLSNN